jgi:hypothetical protein
MQTTYQQDTTMQNLSLQVYDLNGSVQNAAFSPSIWFSEPIRIDCDVTKLKFTLFCVLRCKYSYDAAFVTTENIKERLLKNMQFPKAVKSRFGIRWVQKRL